MLGFIFLSLEIKSIYYTWVKMSEAAIKLLGFK